MNRKAWLLVLGVFLLGVAMGVVVTHFAEQRVIGGPGPRSGSKEDWKTRVLNNLTKEVSLSPDQQQKILVILEDTKKNYDSIYDTIRPQMEQTRQEGRARIRSVLTPEQLPKFEEHLKRMDERRKQQPGGR
jgi:Spy/CpxP family protein refolding chaperone